MTDTLITISRAMVGIMYLAIAVWALVSSRFTRLYGRKIILRLVFVVGVAWCMFYVLAFFQVGEVVFRSNASRVVHGLTIVLLGYQVWTIRLYERGRGS